MFDNVFGPEQTHAMREALELVAERLRATNGEFDARRRQQLADIVLDVVAQSPKMRPMLTLSPSKRCGISVI